MPTADNIVYLCDPHHNEVEGPGTGAWDRIYALKAIVVRGKRESAETVTVESDPEFQRIEDETRAEMRPEGFAAEVTPNATIEAKRMWEGGPLRQFSRSRVTSAFIPYGKRGSTPTFAGRYVCDGCREPVIGAYCVRAAFQWLCGACRGEFKQRRRQLLNTPIAGVIQ